MILTSFFCAATIAHTNLYCFEDVPSGHWAASAISRLWEEKLITGYPNGSFNDPSAKTSVNARIHGFLNQIEAEGLWVRPTTITSQRGTGSRYEVAVIIPWLLESWKKRLDAETFDRKLQKFYSHAPRLEFWLKELSKELMDLDEMPDALFAKLKDLQRRTKEIIGKR